MTTVNSLAGFQDIFYHVTLHLAAHLEVSDASYHESSDSKAVRRTLARLARVHSGLTRPAIVALWRRLWDDRPLRHLLWVVGIARKTSSRCQWEIPPLEIRSRRAFWPKSSWGRFQEYASLVREIVLDPFVGSGTMDAVLKSKIWQDDFWCRLSSVLGNTLILPNLDVASLLTPDSFTQRPFDTGVLSLLNPSIRELNVILRRADTYDESKVRSALADCFSLFRDLEVLSVEISVPALNLGPLAQSLPRLRYLRLDTGFQVNSDHLALLSAFRSLHYLSIDLSPGICLDHPVAFARLRTLRVLSNGFAALGVLIAHMDAPQLRTLSISESHRDSSIMHGELQNILRTLVVKCPFLTVLEWESEQVVRPYWFGTTLAKLFSPLLSHPTIRSFSANFIGLIVCYTPADFRAVAKAWPDLQTFRLYDHMDFSHTVDHYADVESLLELAHHCPHLRDLHIPELKFDVDCLGAAMETTPHGLGGLGVARFRVCSGEQDLDHHREREGLTQFRRWAERIFPFAMIHTPSLM